MKLLKPCLLLITFFLYANNSAAILAPYYQDMKEIQAILEDKNITEKAGQGAHPIQSISKVIIGDRTGWKLVLGPQGDCSLIINVEYKKPLKEGFVGPAVFTLHPEELVCQQPSNTSINTSAPSTMLPKLEDSD